MICETCEELQTADGNPNLYPFACREAQRQIKNPYIKQKWCPKDLKRRKRIRARLQDQTLQTDYREREFINGLPLSKLEGYIKGLNQRDPTQTDFDIDAVRAYAEGKLQKNL